jgi:hypothetical protein
MRAKFQLTKVKANNMAEHHNAGPPSRMAAGRAKMNGNKASAPAP